MVYLPEKFEIRDTSLLHEVIDRFPLATVFSVQDGTPQADHIPLLLDRNRHPHGTLIGHIARNNPLWNQRDPSMDVLAVFQAAEAYISPNWYPTKSETHEVVPTWNYAVVHASGPLIVHQEVKWIRGAVGKLTQAMESSQDVPWKMGDAPQPFLAGQLKDIVGIEIPIHKLVGKWKASQNRTDKDRNGAIAGLQQTSDPAAERMIDEMQRVIRTSDE